MSKDRAPAVRPTFARVVRTEGSQPRRDEPKATMVEVGGARIQLGRGFERETLADVLEVLRAGGAR